MRTLAVMITSVRLLAIDFAALDTGVPSPFIKEVRVTESFLWVATAQGLVRQDLKRKTTTVFTSANGLPDSFITSIAISPDEKEVWAGTPKGLARIADGKITVYDRKNKELSDDRVNSLLLDGDTLYVGTAFGVDVFNIRANVWKGYTAIEGLAGNNIQALAPEGDLIWAAGADGISYYDKNEDFWVAYGATNGLTASLVTSLVIDGDAIWIGSSGGGLGRFDKAALRFEMFTTDLGLIDDNVQTLIDDGEILWIGTFDGLSQLDKRTLRFTNYSSKNGLQEPSVTSGAVSGEKLYVGTDGKGLFSARKGIPQISYSPGLSGYKSAGTIQFYGTALSSSDLKSLAITYRKSEDLTGSWNNAGINLQSAKNGRNIQLGSLSTKGIPDGRYAVRIEITDDAGMKNSTQGVFIVDNQPPEVDLFFRAPEKGERQVNVAGRYNEANLQSLTVQLGKRTVYPEIDRVQKRFRFPYVTDSGEKIRVIAEDIAKNSVSIEKVFAVDSNPPVLTVREVDPEEISGNVVILSGEIEEENLDTVIVNPGQIIAEVQPLGTNKWEFRAKAPVRKEGNYTFQVSAFDKGGKSASRSVTLKFYSDISLIEVDEDKIPKFTLKNSLEITGNVLGPPLKSLVLEPGGVIPEIRPDKSFKALYPLRKGKNDISVIGTRGNGERIVLDYTVEYDERDLTVRLNLASRSFGSENVTVDGLYERGVLQINVNGKPVTLDKENRTFRFPVILKPGNNEIVITSVDELGRRRTLRENLILDRDAPTVYVRSLPTETGLNEIPIRGHIRDLSPVVISLFPAGEIREFNPASGDFTGKVFLTGSENRIFIQAVDETGNKTLKDFYIAYDSRFPKKEEGDGAQYEEEIASLRNEIERLKGELANRPTRTGGDLSVAGIPGDAGLYFAPLPGKIKSYPTAAKIYLGDEKYALTIAAYNGVDASVASRALIPNPAFFRELSKSSNPAFYESVMRTAGRSAAGSSAASSDKAIARMLSRSGKLREIRQRAGYTVFVTSNNSHIIFASGPVNSAKVISDEKLSSAFLIVARSTGFQVKAR